MISRGELKQLIKEVISEEFSETPQFKKYIHQKEDKKISDVLKNIKHCAEFSISVDLFTGEMNKVDLCIISKQTNLILVLNTLREFKDNLDSVMICNDFVAYRDLELVATYAIKGTNNFSRYTVGESLCKYDMSEFKNALQHLIDKISEQHEYLI